MGNDIKSVAELAELPQKTVEKAGAKYIKRRKIKIVKQREIRFIISMDKKRATRFKKYPAGL